MDQCNVVAPRRIAAAVVVALTLTLAAQAAPATTVILVRHGEKVAGAPAMNDDPALTPEGEGRAQRLATMLRFSGVTTIYTTPFTRTRNTAAPVAAMLKVTPVEVKPGPTFAADIAAKIRALPAGSTVLVVGHSNTTPNVIKALGIPNPPAIDDATEFDNLFVVTLAEEPRLLVLKY